MNTLEFREIYFRNYIESTIFFPQLLGNFLFTFMHKTQNSIYLWGFLICVCIWSTGDFKYLQNMRKFFLFLKLKLPTQLEREYDRKQRVA